MDISKLDKKAIELIEKINEKILVSDIAGLQVLLAENPKLFDLNVFGPLFEKSLLHYAASNGKLEMCKVIFGMGMDINVLAETDTPLCDASCKGHFNVVKWLVEHGASIDGLSSTIVTPLMGSIIFGHQEIAKYLIAKGANINRLHLRLNQTPLDAAIIWGRTEIVDIFDSMNAKSTIKDTDWSRVFGGSIIQYVNDHAGKVLPISLLPIVGDNEIRQYLALVNKNKNKLLFTVGLFAIHKPMIELFIVLDSSWNMFDHSPKNQFPSILLLELSNQIINGLRIDEKFFISREDKQFKNLEWPEGICGLLLCDIYWNQKLQQENYINELEEEKVTLFTLVPIKKNINPNNYLIEKSVKNSWNKYKLILNS